MRPNLTEPAPAHISRAQTTDRIDTIADGVAGRCPIPAVLDDLLAVADHVPLVEEHSRHCHGAPGLRRSRWPGSRTRMNKISYSGYRFPPEIIQQAIWFYLRFTLSLRDVEDFIGGARSGGVLRDGSALGESFRTDDCGRLTEASPKTSYDLASGRGCAAKAPTAMGVRSCI